MPERFNWSRLLAIVVKEFIQLSRDRLTFAMMIGIPLIQLTLFGFAINGDGDMSEMAIGGDVLDGNFVGIFTRFILM